MGNYIEPAREAISYHLFFTDLSDLYAQVPIEVKIHIFSYLPVNNCSNLLLISKTMNHSIKSSNELLSIWYNEMLIKVREGYFYTLGQVDKCTLPASLNLVRIPVSFCENLDHANYYRLKWVGVKEMERRERNRRAMQCVRSTYNGPKVY